MYWIVVVVGIAVVVVVVVHGIVEEVADVEELVGVGNGKKVVGVEELLADVVAGEVTAVVVVGIAVAGVVVAHGIVEDVAAVEELVDVGDGVYGVLGDEKKVVGVDVDVVAAVDV